MRSSPTPSVQSVALRGEIFLLCSEYAGVSHQELIHPPAMTLTDDAGQVPGQRFASGSARGTACGTVFCPAEPELAAHGPEHVASP